MVDIYGELQRTILNNIPDQAWLKDKNSRYILVNEAFMAACGHPEHEILGHTPDKVWSTEWAQVYMRTDQAVVSSGRRSRYEESRISADGMPRWFDTIKTPIRDADGAVIGTVGISRDITDRKRFERDMARLNRLYALRSGINKAITQIGRPDELLSRVCRIAVEAGGLQLAWICLPEDATQGVACHASTQALQEQFMAGAEAGWYGLGGFFPAEPRAYVCRDIARPRRFGSQARVARSLGMGSFVALPLTQAGKPVGYCLLFARDADFFSPDIARLVGALSRDLSFSLDYIAEAARGRQAREELLESRSRLRELSAHLQTVREAERTRISRELHDELGQSLTALRLGLNFLETHRPAAEDTAWRQHVRRLKEIADSTVESVQRIAADLRPPVLDELGLGSAIEWLAESFAERSGLRCALQLPQRERDFGPEISTGVFRIVQEALTNARRHGNATAVSVSLDERAGMLHVVIADNGCGIDASQATPRGSLGLLGMRERALMLGGRLTVCNQEAGGTRVEAEIPVAYKPQGG
jgi:PAS domain S-box-containing protein